MSGRYWQRGLGQWTKGKSFDTFCPVGPVIATAGAVGDPNKLGIKCRLNGKTMQASTIFTLASLILRCVNLWRKSCLKAEGSKRVRAYDAGLGILLFIIPSGSVLLYYIRLLC